MNKILLLLMSVCTLSAVSPVLAQEEVLLEELRIDLIENVKEDQVLLTYTGSYYDEVSDWEDFKKNVDPNEIVNNEITETIYPASNVIMSESLWEFHYFYYEDDPLLLLQDYMMPFLSKSKDGDYYEYKTNGLLGFVNENAKVTEHHNTGSVVVYTENQEVFHGESVKLNGTELSSNSLEDPNKIVVHDKESGKVSIITFNGVIDILVDIYE